MIESPLKEAESLLDADASLIATATPDAAKLGDSNDRVWVGFDLGGTKMSAVLFDRKFEPIARRKKKTRGAEGATAGVERIRSTSKSCWKSAISTGLGWVESASVALVLSILTRV